MRGLIAIMIVFAASMLVTALGQTNDMEDVKAAYREHIERANRGDVDAFLQQHLPGHTAFGPTGALLTKWDSIEEEKQQRPDLARPAATPTRVRHLEAQLYGNAAVVTGYLISTVTLTDGTTRPGTRRVTSVWIKQGGKWIEVHDHMSTLIAMSAPPTPAQR